MPYAQVDHPDAGRNSASWWRRCRGIEGEREGLADWIEAQAGDAPEHNETIGWHLEQAHQHLPELSSLGERVATPGCRRASGVRTRRRPAGDQSHHRPGDLTGAALRMRMLHGRIHFAGSDIAPLVVGGIEGAMETGASAARNGAAALTGGFLLIIP
jgi:hypothetical protein